MPTPRAFSLAERRMLNAISSLSGHGSARLAELLQPFLCDTDESGEMISVPLGTLQKRIERITQQSKMFRSPIVGHYAVHDVQVHFEGRNANQYALVVMERSTGLLYVEVFPRIRFRDLTATLEFAQKHFQIQCKKIVFICDFFNTLKSKRKDSDGNYAITRERYEDLIKMLVDAKLDYLRDCREYALEHWMDTDNNFRILNEEYTSRVKLNAMIKNKVNLYNQTPREKFKTTERTSSEVVPVDRLYRYLCEEARKKSTKIPLRDRVIETATFAHKRSYHKKE